MKKLASLLVVVSFFAGSLAAQMTGTGAYPFSSMDTKGFDSINLGNLNTRFSIPIVNRTGRGIGFTYTIQNEGLIWKPTTSGSITTWTPDPVWGFSALLNGTGFSGYLSHSSTIQVCPGGSGPKSGQQQGVRYFNFVYHDPYGVQHSFQYTYTGGCAGDGTTGTGSTTDGSGYSLINNSQIRSRNGVVITPAQSAIGQDNANITDSKGNKITSTGGNSFTDTLGVTALTITGSSPRVFTYPVTLQSDSATTASSTISYKQYNVRTNFQCSGIVEYGSTSANLVDRLTQADGTFYAFTYESTPGTTTGEVTARLASITLPTGGTINYA